MKDETWGNVIQLTGVLLLGGGISCEIILGGDIHFLIITIGAIIFAVGTKIKGS